MHTSYKRRRGTVLYNQLYNKRQATAVDAESMSLRHPVVHKYKQLHVIFMRCLQFTFNVISNTRLPTNIVRSRVLLEYLCHNLYTLLRLLNAV